MSRVRAWAANVGFAMVGLLAGLLVAEACVRLLAPQPTGLSHQDRFGLAKHYPGITRRLPQYGTVVTMNSAGMRDREHALAKPPGVYRILLTGDSFVEALQVPIDSSLAALLEADLEARTGRKVEVIAAGVSGWGTDEALRYLTEYGRAYDPDLVVVAMTLHNDVSDNLREEWHTVRDGVLVEQPRQPMSTWEYRMVSARAYIATRFQLYQLWRLVRHRGETQGVRVALDRHIIELFQSPPPARIARGFDLTGLLLRRIQEVAAEDGARVALVLLPLRVQMSDSSFANFVRASGVSPSLMIPNEPQRRMRAIADSLGIPVVDLLPSFRAWLASGGAPLYLPRDGHWEVTGHRVAAAAVADSITQLIEAGSGPN